MMNEIKPLSKRKRKIRLIILWLIFFIAGPVIILFSAGYSLGEVVSMTKVKLQPTGGVYVTNIGIGSVVTIDDKDQKTASFLDRSILFQRLSPEEHYIKVEKESYLTWSKTVTVFPNRVTEIHPVLIPEIVEATKIIATSTLNDLTKEFKEKADALATTTEEITSNSDVKSYIDDGKLYVSWESISGSPYFTCSSEDCELSEVVHVSEDILDYVWYPSRNDAVIILTEQSIYIAELDTRNDRKITSIIDLNEIGVEGISVSTSTLILSYKDNLYINDEGTFYQINLELLEKQD